MGPTRLRRHKLTVQSDRTLVFPETRTHGRMQRKVVPVVGLELQRAARKKPLIISGVSGAGVREALLKLAVIIRKPKLEAKEEGVWQPELAG